MEKQIETIESLIKDKQQFQDKVEELQRKVKDADFKLEKTKVELQEKYKKDIKREKEQWQV